MKFLEWIKFRIKIVQTITKRQKGTAMKSTKGIFIAAVIGTNEMTIPPQPGKDINMRPQTFKVDSD
eukprot:4201252-Ditylum_brightwellii.AAC.1